MGPCSSSSLLEGEGKPVEVRRGPATVRNEDFWHDATRCDGEGAKNRCRRGRHEF